MTNFKFSFRHAGISFLIISLSFTLMSFHPGNNWRIEKRHYRKGFYVDLWSKPKTYPRVIVTPPVVVEKEKVETPKPVQSTGIAIPQIDINVDQDQDQNGNAPVNNDDTNPLNYSNDAQRTDDPPVVAPVQTVNAPIKISPPVSAAPERTNNSTDEIIIQQTDVVAPTKIISKPVKNRVSLPRN